MNNAHSETRSHVIPKWVQPQSSLSKGETQIPRATPFIVNQATKTGIETERMAFQENPTLESAYYLLGASVLIGDEALSHESARFIKEHDTPGKIITEFADNILGIEYLDMSVLRVDFQIANMKSWLREFPRSAIGWIELGRLYTIKGNKEKARRAVITALSLAPYDRYIVRCGVRFFLHIHDYDAAWNYIRKANSQVRDPWLKATELNVAMMRDKRTPDFRGFLPAGNTKGLDIFHYSELYESAGMIEFNSGNQNKAKKHFRAAWGTPAESVVTHGEWLIRNKLPGLKDTAPLDYARSFEALTWVQYYQYDFEAAMDTVTKWQEEEPYSKSAYVVGACIAGSARLHDAAADFAEQGLRANPNDSRLLNSLCYELLRAGRLDGAREAFKRWTDANVDRKNDVFYLATEGLLMFKRGNASEGRKLYFEAISKCKEQGIEKLIGKAHLNLALAEVEQKTFEAATAVSKALELSTGDILPDIRSLRQELIEKTKAINIIRPHIQP